MRQSHKRQDSSQPIMFVHGSAQIKCFLDLSFVSDSLTHITHDCFLLIIILLYLFSLSFYLSELAISFNLFSFILTWFFICDSLSLSLSLYAARLE